MFATPSNAIGSGNQSKESESVAVAGCFSPRWGVRQYGVTGDLAIAMDRTVASEAAR